MKVSLKQQRAEIERAFILTQNIHLTLFCAFLHTLQQSIAKL